MCVCLLLGPTAPLFLRSRHIVVPNLLFLEYLWRREKVYVHNFGSKIGTQKAVRIKAREQVMGRAHASFFSAMGFPFTLLSLPPLNPNPRIPSSPNPPTPNTCALLPLVEPLPVAQTEGQNTAEVATGEESTPTIASNSESVTGSDSGSDSSLSSSAESSSVVASGGHGDEEESGRELHSADAAVDRGVGGLPAAAAATATTTTTTTGASAAAEVVETRGVEEAEVDGGSGDENLARHGEPLLPERDGFAALRKVLKVLPGGGEELEMDMERLRVIRSDMTKVRPFLPTAFRKEIVINAFRHGMCNVAMLKRKIFDVYRDGFVT